MPLEQLTKNPAVSAPPFSSQRPVLEHLKALETQGRTASSLTLPTLEAGEQYRFHIDMTRCIGCRCCEVACNEQNNNPPEVKWRRVGEIEGGSYPHVLRLHLSMSCNHCLEPSCLEGCPVDAYTKLPNGIVVHNAETCIGCQYCVWNCPYGAPQYHPDRQIVTKCHLCVDRLENQQFPACVEACPTQAIELEKVNAAEWKRAITLADAPGVPAADLTFSTTRITLPEDLPDSFGKAAAQQLVLQSPHWPLVFFLVLGQWSVGLLAAALAIEWTDAQATAAAAALGGGMAVAAFLLGQSALGVALFHLGKPIHALRALKAWRRSWLSREALVFSLFAFFGFFAAAAGLAREASISDWPIFQGAARVLKGSLSLWLLPPVALGLLGIICSARIYMIPARPAWNNWRTPLQFFGTAVLLGAASALAAITVGGPSLPAGPIPWVLAAAVALAALTQAFVPWTLVLEGVGADDASIRGAALLLSRQLRHLFWLRTFLLCAVACLAPVTVLLGNTPAGRAGGLATLGLAVLLELVGRYLFFVAVVPRHTPGSFFSQPAPS